MLKRTSTVVIGDVQGCARTLSAFLASCAEHLGHFETYFVGDLINRGTESLSVLQHVSTSKFETVLGNHELYVLGVVAGALSRQSDTLDDLFDSPQLMTWVDWLRHRPILLTGDEHVIVHAGVHPLWTRSQAFEYAARIEEGLKSDSWAYFLKGIIGKKIKDPELAQALKTFTRMRMLTEAGDLDHSYKGPPESAPSHLSPWYRDYEGQVGRIIFGHWAALGARRMRQCISLDSGCVWGRTLTGYELVSKQFISCSVVDTDRFKGV